MLFTPMELFDKLEENYVEIGAKWKDNNAVWTKKILGFFYDLGMKQKYDVYASPKIGKKNTHEYLVDLSWVFENEKGSWIELALEEEWSLNKDAIFFDFHKLLDVKAKLKVFICFPNERDREDFPKEMAKDILNQANKMFDEKYLIVVFSRHERRKPSERIKIHGYEFNYIGDRLNKFESKWFPDSP